MSIVFVLLLAGVLDFGFLFTNRLAVENAAREASRWAAKHPTAWSSASSPASNTIEGEAVASGSGDIVVNNDADIVIQYSTVDVSSTTITYCGRYYAASPGPGFVGQGSYTQTSCVLPGSLINVTVSYVYTFATGGLAYLGPNVTVSGVAASIEEN